MAAYSIVINLSGNAISKSRQLADNLTRANVAASTLHKTLPKVGNDLRNVNMKGLQGNWSNPPYNFKLPKNVNPGGKPNYTRHKHSRIVSFGTGFNFGGFSGRSSTILQPDENGMIFGMNAEKLMRRANIAAISAQLMSVIGKTILKTIAVSTIAPIVVGGGGLGLAIRALQSESFAGGVRLISRRRQAELGLGSDLANVAMNNADALAASYGLDRSSSISSINVLTGLGVGGTSRKLNVGEATGLTKIGGLIAQQSGASFEKVMTNIQQLLVQDTPHLRDIRELLNQAPILGKYAMREMERTGATGDVRSYLKDQNAIMSVLKSYELDNATNAGMQARGRIQLAQQDAWATVAGNDPFWRMIGENGSRVITAMGAAANKLLTVLADSPEFNVMIRNLEMMLTNAGEKLPTLLDKLIAFVDAAAAHFGIDLGDKNKATLLNDQDLAIRYAANSELGKSILRSAWENAGLGVSKDNVQREREFNQWLQNDAVRALQNDKNLVNAIVARFPLNQPSDYVGARSPMFGVGTLDSGVDKNVLAFQNAKTLYDPTTLRFTPEYKERASWERQPHMYASYGVPIEDLKTSIDKFIAEQTKIGTLDPTLFGKTAGDSGEDLTGFNRDRRALEIHFHDKLVEWNSNIYADDPQQTVEEVADNIEAITSTAIQKALLGATNKMSSRWY